MRSTPIVLALCMILIAAGPVLAARASGVSVQSEHVSATILTTPKLLEPGPISFAIALREDGQPLRNAPVWISLATTQKTFFAATVMTDNEGVARVALYLDEGGKPVLTMVAAGETLSSPILVSGRGILVAGFLTALVVLVVLLVDRP